MNLIDILNNYAFNKMQNGGLLLLPMPTGSGKTYTVHQFISDVVESGKKDKIIFVTSLNKNINPDELKKHFHNKELFEEKVLWIKSFSDLVIERLSKASQNVDIEFDEFKKLKKAVEFYNQNKYDQEPAIKDIVKEKLDSIRETLEPQFRRKIKNVLNEHFKKNKIRCYKDKLAYVGTHYKWLIDIYPQILTKKKQVYLMSMDKFLLRNDPIIDKSEYIFKELSENAIIFIDEFDSTKKIVLKRLIENAIKTQIDYIEAFNQIHNNLIAKHLPSDMTIASKKQKEGKYGEDGLKEYIARTQKRCNDIYEKYEMELRFKLEDVGDPTQTFLFQDLRNITISNQKDKGEKILFKKDNDKTQNIIKFSKYDDDKAKNFKIMLEEVRGFLKYFAGCINTLAINYQEVKKDNGNEDYSLEDSIKSYLDIFISDDNIKNHFVEEILLRRKNKEEQSVIFFDGSFYENGFSYYSVEDDDEHSFTSSIKMTDLSSTPEKILVDLCSNARVFGISATAKIQTCIGNYVLDYIKEKIGNKYFEFSQDEFNVLKLHFEKSINHYDNVHISPEKISDFIFPQNDNWEEIENTIKQKCDDFSQKRLKKIASVFNNFIQKDDIRSMLCFCNAFPNEDKFYERIFDGLVDDSTNNKDSKLSYEDNVIVLRSVDFEATKNIITKKLSDGEKILVLSTYQTVGAGQNLQYKIPENIKTTCINDFEKRAEKDFDAIYLELPTNLFTRLDDDKISVMVEYISQLEYIKEEGELSDYEVKDYIKGAFRRFYYNEKTRTLSFKNFIDYKKFVRSRVIQAIGRICRTNSKSENIYIYYDEDLCKNIDAKISEQDLLNTEFQKLAEKIQNTTSNTDVEKQKNINHLITKSKEALNRIIKYVAQSRRGWKEEYMEQWQNIRHYVLQHPTMNETEYAQMDYLYKPFYLKLPTNGNKLWFKRSGDYDDLDISFEQKDGFEDVSEEAARLKIILDIPYIRQMFENENFAMTFKDNPYILCPPVFTNIYKGALGEYVGKEIFKQILHIELEEINNCDWFELFDFKVKDKNIYVDFKHWNEYSDFLPSRDEIIPHITKKLNDCRGDKALVVNILAENEYKFNNNGRIVEISRLYDCDNKTFDQNVINKLIEILR